MKPLPLFEFGSKHYLHGPASRAWFIAYNEAPAVRVRLGYFNAARSLIHFMRGHGVNVDGFTGHGWQLRVWRFAVCVFFPEAPAL